MEFFVMWIYGMVILITGVTGLYVTFSGIFKEKISNDVDLVVLWSVISFVFVIAGFIWSAVSAYHGLIS
jgi:hypothetical protein